MNWSPSKDELAQDGLLPRFLPPFPTRTTRGRVSAVLSVLANTAAYCQKRRLLVSLTPAISTPRIGQQGHAGRVLAGQCTANHYANHHWLHPAHPRRLPYHWTVSTFWHRKAGTQTCRVVYGGSLCWWVGVDGEKRDEKQGWEMAVSAVGRGELGVGTSTRFARCFGTRHGPALLQLGTSLLPSFSSVKLSPSKNELAQDRLLPRFLPPS